MDSADIARVRSLPLSAVLEGLGATRDPKDPKHNWRYGGSRITVTEALFYDHNEAGARHRMKGGRAGGAGAIDLVQYLKDVDFRGAVKALGGLPVRAAPRPMPVPVVGKHPPVSQRPPPTPAANSERARSYLITRRALPARLVDVVLGTGAVFADTQGNVVFRLTNAAGSPVGYELRGTYEKPYHSVHGEKGLFVTQANSARIAVFVESGIEALSYRALRGAGLIVSTTGSAVELPATFARALADRGFTLVAAFNADAAGDRQAARLGERLGFTLHRDRPDSRFGKDWNDQLQRQRVVAAGEGARLPAGVRSEIGTGRSSPQAPEALWTR